MNPYISDPRGFAALLWDLAHERETWTAGQLRNVARLVVQERLACPVCGRAADTFELRPTLRPVLAQCGDPDACGWSGTDRDAVLCTVEPPYLEGEDVNGLSGLDRADPSRPPAWMYEADGPLAPYIPDDPGELIPTGDET